VILSNILLTRHELAEAIPTNILCLVVLVHIDLRSNVSMQALHIPDANYKMEAIRKFGIRYATSKNCEVNEM
jgi:hypothetical protein